MLRDRNGRLVEVEINARMIFAEGAQRFITVFRDISQSKVAERAQLLINQATNDAIWDWDLRSEQVWWNNKVAIFGYEPEEIDPAIEWWQNHIDPDDRERVINRLDYFINQRIEKWFDKYRFERKDGSFAHIYDKGHVLFDEKHQPEPGNWGHGRHYRAGAGRRKYPD